MTSPNGDPGDVAAGLLLRVTELVDRLDEVDTREAGHHGDIGARLGEIAGSLAGLRAHIEGIAATVADQAATLTALEGLDQRLAELAEQLADPDDSDRRGYRPGPQPKWWRLASAPAGTREARAGGAGEPGAGPDADSAAGELAVDVQRLSAWVSEVFQPGYGHLASGLGACWAQHPLCLYTVDWLHELWSVLYLTRRRTAGTLAGQAEFQTRLLPAAAAQMAAETSGCGHRARLGRPGAARALAAEAAPT